MSDKINYASIKDIIRFLSEHEMVPRKKWGQNFLINMQVRDQIISVLNPRHDEYIWEIGPGLGVMTEEILPQVKKLLAFEIDRGYIEFLKKRFAEYSGFSIISGDVIKTWRSVNKEQEVPDKVVGNLPYNSANKIILDFLRDRFSPKVLVFLVQKEAAFRLTAKPGTKQYSSFSVLGRISFKIRLEAVINPGSFYPAPDVRSALISLEPRYPAMSEKEWGFFTAFTKQLFSSRRKTIRNNLPKLKGPELSKEKGFEQRLEKQMEEINILPSMRAEELQPEQVLSLSNIYYRTIEKKTNK